eukprot:NODE_331_length_9425_cov_0.815355.p2 type:complete len:1110 gc:universal NODE_331_length_9425_cov_0.815355:2118-5447(+)
MGQIMFFTKELESLFFNKVTIRFKLCFMLFQKMKSMGIPLIPQEWNSHLFKQSNIYPTEELSSLSLKHLEKHLPTRSTNEVVVPNLKLPPLAGGSLKDHLYTIGQLYLNPTQSLVNEIIASNVKKPLKWSTKPGWSKYMGEVIEKVPYPNEKVFVFDTEVLVPQSKYPILAVAKSSKYWYSWCAPWFHLDAIENDTEQISTEIEKFPIEEKLISFGNNDTKLFIGHMVSFERAKILQEYLYFPTKYQYLDTLSMHISVCGLSSQQRTSFIKQKKIMDLPAPDFNDPTKLLDWNDLQPDKWVQESSMNSLLHVAKFHCDIDLNKSIRDIFVKGNLEEVQQNAQTLFQYCAEDVEATHQVFKAVYPKFLKKCPHPISQAGPMIMSKSFLPVSKRWDDFVEINEAKTNALQFRIESRLKELALEALDKIIIRGPLLPVEILEGVNYSTPLELERYEFCSVDTKLLMQHPHWCFLDWRMPSAKYTKIGMPYKGQKLRNYPLWVHQIIAGNEIKISMKVKTAVYLMEAKLEKQYVWYHPNEGYCLLTQSQDVLEKYKHLTQFPFESNFRSSYKGKSALGYDSKTKTVSNYEDTEESILDAYKNYNVIRLSSEKTIMGTFFTKSIGKKKSILSCKDSECLENIILLANNASYWVSARKRIESQFIVPAKSMPDNKGVIMPMIVPCGTVTRRSVEPTWVTAANVKKGRFGSDLKMQIQAPSGYSIIGADVDSEELWIASLLADGQFEEHGTSAIGFMTLQGQKKDKTDMHSVTAKLVNISRDEAKGFNYARIYGSGEKHAARTLELGQSISKEEADEKAKQLFKGTKGMRLEFRAEGLKLPRRVWCGGTESLMFNVLDNAAELPEPCTPTLRAVIPDSLLPRNVDRDFVTTRINWIVQGSGVDYLHMLLVLMNHFIQQSGIDCKFMLSVHDEIRFLCNNDDIYKGALLLQYSNLIVRAFFAESIGVESLPLSCSFFSAIDVDTVLRKEPTISSETFPEIPIGKTIDIYDIVKNIDFDNFQLNGVNQVYEAPETKKYLDLVFPFVKLSKDAHMKWIEMQLAEDKDEFYRLGKELRVLVKNLDPRKSTLKPVPFRTIKKIRKIRPIPENDRSCVKIVN